jgi:hypothetical protein
MGKLTEQRTDRQRNWIRHRVEFNEAVMRAEFVEWLEQNGWLGYNPAGYGDGVVYYLATKNAYGETLREAKRDYCDATSYVWVWQHAASCD